MAYDPDSRILSVWFVASGKRYEFEDVPPETFAAFRAAFAKGPLLQRPHPQSLPLPSGWPWGRLSSISGRSLFWQGCGSFVAAVRPASARARSDIGTKGGFANFYC
ncbi:KTSC domain-containing protein [Mesorhizobium sp.]|uniref:KTSC domain-containing protein n=2 Tax=Mesorhizobium sp. TaxID=1871066 RepID=UPI00257BF5D3|nr:KTSC domain-containing protein [Mesorhizobium sp.]